MRPEGGAPNMKVLITGGYGQLGNEINRCLASGTAEIGPIPAWYAGAEVVNTDADTLDITDEAQVEELIAREGFDLVVNCAAYTNVDACEVNEGLARKVNALGPRNLARSCARHGAKLVHVSTDYVFAGDDPRPRTEADPCAPRSAYGRTKLEGEELVRAELVEHFIVRTAWLYGYVGKNFAKTMMRLAADRNFVTVVDDQLGNPTSANDLAYEILRLAATDQWGTYHCTNEGVCSWADFAQAAIEGAGLSCEVRRCTSAEYKQMNPASADRPAFSALENAHLAQTVGNEMRPWREALAMYVANLPELEG